ncbi:MAG TPA: TonB-dependent receptor [Myxococcales bacterium]|nr:TonB-dependent receptor [Myxococcales bacterium]
MFEISRRSLIRLLPIAVAALLLLLAVSGASAPAMAQESDSEAPEFTPVDPWYESEEGTPKEEKGEDLEAEDLSAYLDVDSEEVNEEIEERYKAVEEIIVTSQAGGSNLQDLGVSVAAFDAEYLDAIGAQSIADIAQFTPNLEIRTVFAASNPTLFIRGVGLRDFNANSSSSVAVYNDDIYMNSPAGQLAQLFDVQQVEVLRGPQGTLYGRNASAGAIRVISRKPTGDLNGYTKVSYGNYNSVEGEAAMETPITETLTTRVAGIFRSRRGTTLNRCGDPRWKDRRPISPTGDAAQAGFGTLDFDYVVHGAYQDVGTGSNQSDNPGYFPYGTSKGCFNTDTLAPTTPVATQYGEALVAGPAWTPGWVGFDTPQYGNLVDNPAAGPPPVDQWVNEVENWAVRGLLRWQPSDTVDWVLNLHGGTNSGGGRQFQVIGAQQRPDQETPDLLSRNTFSGYFDRDLLYFGDRIHPQDRGFGQDLEADPPLPGVSPFYHLDPAGGDPHAGDYNINEPESLKLYGTSLSGDIRLKDTLLFKTISGFEGNQRSLRVNLDGQPIQGLEPLLSNESWQVTQEFKLIYEGENGLIGEIGANYLYENLHTHNEFDLDPITNFSIQDYTMTTSYASAYAWLTWAPVEDFSVVAGGRFNYENKEMNLQTTRISPLTGLPAEFGVINVNEVVEDTGISGDISFNYKPTDEHLVFFKYSRGYKGPHINGLILDAGQTSEEGRPLTTPVLPEEVDALELGIKTSWFDNTLSINGAVFYYDYKNIQIFQLRNTGANSVPVQQLVNANDADIFGAEIEVRSHPLYGYEWVPEGLDGLEIFASFGWLNSHYTDFTQTLTAAVENPPGAIESNTFDYSGNRLINSPEFAFAGYAALPWVTAYGTLATRFDWTYKSEIFFGPENDPNVGEDPLWLMNVRLAYTTPDGVVELAGWVRNVTDQAYSQDILNLTRFQGTILHAIGDPRTYGATLQVRF